MSNYEKTVVGDFGNTNDGFFVLSPLSEPTQQALNSIQQQLSAALPQGSLWLPHGDQMHITFLHILNPEMELPSGYSDRSTLFATLEDNVLRALGDVVPQDLDIPLRLGRIGVAPPAIFIEWQDDNGTYDELRRRFAQTFALPAGVKPPPLIVHTTIARFYKEIPIADVRQAVEALDVPVIDEHSIEFQLVHEEKIFLQAHEILATFPASHA